MRFSGVILAGGRSTRMGTDKAFAELGSKPLVEWVLGSLEAVTRSLVIVTSHPAKFRAFEGRAAIVRDAQPQAGPLPALRTGLAHSREHWAFVSTCDAPFLRPEFVQALARFARSHDAAVPGSPQERWPLTAFYHAPRCLPAIDRAMARGDSRIVAFYDDIDVRWAPKEELRLRDPELRSLRNLNTPQDLADAAALIPSGGLRAG